MGQAGGKPGLDAGASQRVCRLNEEIRLRDVFLHIRVSAITFQCCEQTLRQSLVGSRNRAGSRPSQRSRAWPIRCGRCVRHRFRDDPGGRRTCFDPFFTTKGSAGGTGLGLSQVYGFVNQSGGHVKIYSEVGHGTALKIYLRRAAAKVAEAQRSQVEVLPTGHVGELVLVVEDEAAVRRHTVEALRELGYTVRHAASGEEALKLLEQAGAVTLLFTDVVMPGISGRQLADVARTTQPDLKVLYTTGYTQNALSIIVYWTLASSC